MVHSFYKSTMLIKLIINWT